MGFVLALALALRCVLAAHAIGSPGLQQDETGFVNAATLRLPGVFLTHSFHGIPLMVFPYIGALKSWLYAPIFSIFGTSAATIRLPVVLLVTAGIAVVYPAVRDLVNRPVAALAFAALCFDNSVFWLTRDDVGPSAIEFALKCALLLCAARLARRLSGRWLVVTLVALALGVFNKLNFIWVVNAAVAVSVIVLVRYRGSVRSRWRLVGLWASGLGVIYVAFAWYYFSQNIGGLLATSGDGLTQPWSLYSLGSSQILSGTWFYDYALRPGDPRMIVVWVTLALFAIGLATSVVSARSRNYPVAYLGVATVLIAMQNLVTQQATAGWHYISIYPCVTVVAAYGFYVVVTRLPGPRRVVSAAMVAGSLGVLAYSGTLMKTYFDALQHEPVNAAWSPAIYTLSRDLTRLRGQVYSADWGIFNPLFALHPSRRYTELAFELANPPPPALPGIAQSLATAANPKLIVTHVTRDLQFPRVNSVLSLVAGSHLRLLMVVRGPGRAPVYDVYSYR